MSHWKRTFRYEFISFFQWFLLLFIQLSFWTYWSQIIPFLFRFKTDYNSNSTVTYSVTQTKFGFLRDSFISTYKLNNWSCSQSLFWWFLKHDFIFKLKIPKSPSGISSITNMCSPNCYLERVSGWKQFQLDFVDTVVSSELFWLRSYKTKFFFFCCYAAIMSL